MERRIKVLRFFAFIVSLIGAMESAFMLFMSSNLWGGFFLFGSLYVLYFLLMRFLVNNKRWNIEDGQETETKSN